MINFRNGFFFVLESDKSICNFQYSKQDRHDGTITNEYLMRFKDLRVYEFS